MVSAVVVAEFTENGVRYQKGQKISISQEQYNAWLARHLVGQIDEVDPDWCDPGSEPK